MDKVQAAASFFQRLGADSSDFISEMMETEMDAGLIELFNHFGQQIERKNLAPESLQTSLLIIGYLVRAHEEQARRQAAGQNNDSLH